MLNATKGFVDTVGNHLPALASPTQAVNNLTKIVVPIIVTIGVLQVAGIDAGPVAYAACCEICTGGGSAIAFPPWLLACLSGCIPLLVAPTP